MPKTLTCLSLALALAIPPVRAAHADGGGPAFVPPQPRAAEELQQMNQPEARDDTGRITVEASVIHVIACTANRRQYYIYQYVNRPGYRAILPPDWGHALGGRDFPTYGEAVTVACGGVAAPGPAMQLGCFRDSNDRVLPEYHQESASMTVGACIADCARQGYAYAGLEYSAHCFCSNRGDFARLGPSDACNMPCAGNRGELCGGTWAIAVFNVHGHGPHHPGGGGGGPIYSASSQELQVMDQGEQVDPSGRITVEESRIHVIACSGGPKSGQQFYIHQYKKRPGFRAILPPDWGHALGGRDFPSYQEAVNAACLGGIQPPVPPLGGVAGDTVMVPSNRPDPVYSKPLEPGAVYRITVTGVFSCWDDHTDGVDGFYCYGTFRCGQPELWGQLLINDKPMSDIARESGEVPTYHPDHRYSVVIRAPGGPLKLQIADAKGSAGDNHGALTVHISRER